MNLGLEKHFTHPKKVKNKKKWGIVVGSGEK